ncbi:MAG: MalM family protein [Woeseia sp.]
MIRAKNERRFVDMVLGRLATGAVVAVCCVFLTSCAAFFPPTLEETIQSLASAPNCCAAAKDFAYEPLEFPGTTSFDISAESPAFDFPTGRSFFKAFELPKQAVPYTITIKGYPGNHVPAQQHHWKPERYSVFVPVVMLLDRDHAVTRLIDEKAVRRVDWTLLPPVRLGMELTVTVKPENQNERFLVVFTPRRLLGGFTVATKPHAILFPGGGAFPTGLRKRVDMYHAPVGDLKITLAEAGPK